MSKTERDLLNVVTYAGCAFIGLLTARRLKKLLGI